MPVTQVVREGQQFVDQPVYEVLHPKPELVTPCAVSVAAAFGHKPPQAIPTIKGYERIRLRWMKPGPDGKLIPK